MNRKTREEMNELSKKVFGTSSRWQKIVNNGVVDSYQEQSTKIVPNRTTGQLEAKNFQVTKPVFRRYTVEQVKELMESILLSRSAVANTSLSTTLNNEAADTFGDTQS